MGSLVKNFITHDAVKKIPPIRESQWTNCNMHRAPPTFMKVYKWHNSRPSTLLKHLNSYIFFLINVKYIVSIYTINNFRWIVLNCSMLFAMVHGIVVNFFIKAIHSCNFVLFPKSFLVQIKVYNVVIHDVAGWYAGPSSAQHNEITTVCCSLFSLFCANLVLWLVSVVATCFIVLH